MKIAPIDIAHKTFARKMMGLDQDEVMEFLRMIAEEMETVIRERNNLREAMREKELQILEFRERDELLKSTITTATKMSDRIQQDATREAKLIMHDAQQQGDAIVRDARESLKKIFQEITDLKRVRMQYEHNLRALMQSHLAMMEQSHKFMPDPEINQIASGHQSANSAAEATSQANAPAISFQFAGNNMPIAPMSQSFQPAGSGGSESAHGGNGAAGNLTIGEMEKIRANVADAIKKNSRPLDV
jgi:cell division initiation protein